MNIEEFNSLAVGVGVLVTAFLNFLIWKANKEFAKEAEGAAAEATERERISELMLTASEKQIQDMKDQLKRDSFKPCRGISNTLREIISVGVSSELMNN